ncbi:MAG TPA: hypothetical protein VKY89_03240 [Thermoanaerobaculia bacterium]|nr:hypothetical protein [Thermoanaerobaculia bacterium]
MNMFNFEQRPPSAASRRWLLIGIFLATAAASCMYRLLVWHHLEQTSALFIGIPTVLAILLALTPAAGTLEGIVLKGVSFALLFAGIFLGEGFICLVMAAPLFFGIALVVALMIRILRQRRRRRPDAAALGLIVLVFAPMSFEGVSDRLSWPRQEQVVSQRLLSATPGEIGSRLAQAPRFERPLPAFLRLGFPRPDGATGAGLRIGDRRVIHFSGGEGKPGDLVLEVVAAGPGLLRYRAVSDTTHIAHWLTWEESEVRWRQTGARTVEVRWLLRYRRDLDPAWYFRPWERFAVRLAASYLIDSLADLPAAATAPPRSPAAEAGAGPAAIRFAARSST